uniref:COX assembly mitochondrial protein homolog n=1 Tax=Phallusia mammillata TaxID=59560 RepID=A0A6F9D9R8_9ASCI|nr:COX assembly mitochondrial protein homolog [Phallusia mammillata]
MLKTLINPYFLTGTGAMVLFGVGVYEHARRQTESTGFHKKDPDPTLRKIEKDVLIPKYMRDRMRDVECKVETDAFNDCCVAQNKAGHSLMAFRACKKESDIMMECMNSKFLDEDYYKLCKALYLHDKALFEKCKVKRRSRQKIKEMVRENEPIEDILEEDQVLYYKAVKEQFAKNGDLDAYDEILLQQKTSTT